MDRLLRRRFAAFAAVASHLILLGLIQLMQRRALVDKYIVKSLKKMACPV